MHPTKTKQVPKPYHTLSIQPNLTLPILSHPNPSYHTLPKQRQFILKNEEEVL